MEIKIKNNITKIITDINRSVSDMEHATKNDNHFYIDLLLSQITYLKGNLEILRQVLGSEAKGVINKQNNIDINYKELDTNNKNLPTWLPQTTSAEKESPTKLSDTDTSNNAITTKQDNYQLNTQSKAYDHDDNNNNTINANVPTAPSRLPLKNIISLNDKFTFVRYLFKNNITIYSEHINSIDKLSTKEEVLTYINKYLSKLYDWDAYPDKKELFIKIVEKQFEQ